ncbi:IS4 family transposase [Bacteroides sp. 519]|nr:IS4 family transposase [Bacteroides sp. 519]NDV60784.1 IS4 family transposase [Bacteroides sp. 519]
MRLFNHNISLPEIIRQIPDEALVRISKDTKVDYCTKVLNGKLMFYLLLYGLLRVDRLSQRGLSDAFSSPLFRTLFNFHGKKTLSHSSISERLSCIDIDFFRQSYECIYQRFSSLYTKKEIANKCLQRVDSTLVKESCNKLRQGLTFGNQYAKQKMIKYTLNFDGMFATFSSIYAQEAYNSETLALPENIMSHFKKTPNHANVYIFDRGQSSAEAFKEMSNTPGLHFVGRLQDNRKLKSIKELPLCQEEFKSGILEKDMIVKLYKKVSTISRNGKESHNSVLVEEEFRIIRFIPTDGREAITLITNMLDITTNDIADMYRRRWDIEVFFRFLKQELNFSHFISLNENGMEVILYMTLITAMLVMIYKKENEIGYKTAIRRMGIELESLVLAIAVIQSGGDLKKTELPDP